MRLLLLVIFSFSLFSFCPAQESNPNGSAAQLKGNVYLLSVFVTTADKEWSIDDKLALSDQQYKAEEWIKQQAQRYGVTLDLAAGGFGIDSPIVVESTDLYNSDGLQKIDWLKEALSKIDYESPSDFLHVTKEIYGVDQIAVLIYPNTKGTGYSFIYDEKYGNDFLESGVIASQYDDGNSVKAATIGQVILRLFGAWNLFESDNTSNEQATKASAEYGNDIMHRISVDINELEIGALTAWRLGWTSNKLASFDFYSPVTK